MPLLSIPAVYDGEKVKLLEDAPVNEAYRVLVTFVVPTKESGTSPEDLERFRASFGAWQDTRPVEETLRDIHEARFSKSRVPEL